MATKRIYYFTAGQLATPAENTAIAALQAQVFSRFTTTLMRGDIEPSLPIRDCDYVCGSPIPTAYAGKPVFNPASPPTVTANKKVIMFTAGIVMTAAELANDVLLKALAIPEYTLVIKNYSASLESPLRVPDFVAGSVPSVYTAAGVPTFAGDGGVTKSAGVMRLIGTQNQQASASALNGTFISAVIKVQAPGGATGVRVIVTNNSAAYGMASAKVSMATTDISAVDTAANAYTPFISGTAFNVVSPNTSDKGFVKGKWNGNNTSRRIYPSNSILPSFGYNNQEEIIISDVIPLVPKRAVDRTAEEYYYICRIAVAGANGQDGLSQIEGGTGKPGNTIFNQWVSTNGADAPLMCIGGLGNTADAVDGSITTNMPGGIGNGWSPVVSFEWIYPAGVTPVSFWHIGDSITEGYEWPRWAVNRKNTNPLRPLHHANIGGSTTRTEAFTGEMYLHLQSLAKPDYVVMPIISVNNYSPLSSFTLANAQSEYTRLQEIAVFLTGLGIKIIWWVPFNFGANPAANDTATPWGYIYNNAKTYAAANTVVWMDINGDSRLVRSVYNASTNPTGWLDPDNTHPSSPTGKAGFAQVYTDQLTALGF